MDRRAFLFLAAVLAAPGDPLAQPSFGEQPVVTGLQGMVTANHPLAAAAGMRILAAGGNAFDAAVATAAATSVVDPSNSSLGGNGFATIYVARTKEVHALNFFGTAPLDSRPELFTKGEPQRGDPLLPRALELEGLRGPSRALRHDGALPGARAGDRARGPRIPRHALLP